MNKVIYIGLAIIFFLLGYLIYDGYLTVKKPIIYYDTLMIETRIPPITVYDTIPIIKTKTHYIEKYISQKDSSDLILIDSLFNLKDSLLTELKKYNVKETAVLDTVIKQDTLIVNYEIVNKLWYINFKFGKRELPQIHDIKYIEKIDSNKYYWYGGSFVLGLILGVVIAK